MDENVTIATLQTVANDKPLVSVSKLSIVIPAPRQNLSTLFSQHQIVISTCHNHSNRHKIFPQEFREPSVFLWLSTFSCITRTQLTTRLVTPTEQSIR